MKKRRNSAQKKRDKERHYYGVEHYNRAKPERVYPGLAYAKQYEEKVKHARNNDSENA